MYKLKSNAPDIVCMSGPCEGKAYRQNEIYEEIPEQDKDRFEIVKTSMVEKEVNGNG